jgi:8-oxo-dGTP pyrophosphatase MutT (NUDIX family)
VAEYVRRLRDIVGGEELLQVPSVSIALRDADGRVLLARHSEGGVWLLPGGAIEPTEVPADAAVREMFEETGLCAAGEDHGMASIARHESPTLLEHELEAKLNEFNERHAGPRRSEQLALAIRDELGRFVAGLTGETFWNVLHIDKLWVDENHRRRGYGRALLDAAEAEARNRGCHVAYLSTFDFQAPLFYTALGYGVFAELQGVPRGATRIWPSKALSA